MISIGKKWLIGVAALSVLGVCDTAYAITLHTTDFIPNATRTNFNGFEGIPGTYNFQGSYTENGIKVEQIRSDYDGIMTVGKFDSGFPQFSGFEGQRSWYPLSGDYGFTRITRSDNSDFVNLGLLRSSGWASWSSVTYVYELLKNGVTVFSGNVMSSSNYATGYLGFSGGGFNEVRLGAYLGNNPNQTLNGYQGLAIDSIELSGSIAQSVPTAVPTPALLPGLVGLGMAALRKRKESQGQAAEEVAQV